ncbi:MAG: SpoIIE family protein phosphatase [Spirochaetales bacterium]|nr:SpoIIE family protein phosphatase [Spirochaetales bacterium]
MKGDRPRRLQAPAPGGPGLALRFTIVCLLLALSGSCARFSQSSGTETPEVIMGRLDLTHWNFEDSGIVSLDGDWRFFWQRLLVSSADGSGEQAQSEPAEFLAVPGLWNRSAGAGQSGYATYRLVISRESRPQVLGIKFQHIPCAFRLYANGRLIVSRGVVGRSAAAETPQWLPGTAYFAAEGPRLVLDVLVSNHHYRGGGLRYPILVGTAEQIEGLQTERVMLESVVLGCLLILGLYHLSLYALRREDRAALFFGLFSLATVGNQLTNGEILLVHMFPAIGWDWLLRLTYLDIYASVALLVRYFAAIFPEDVPRRSTGAFVTTCLAFSMFTLVTGPGVFTRALPAMLLLVVVCMLWMVLLSIRAFWRKRQGARLFLVATSILAASGINDVLLASLLPGTYHLLGVGLVIFFFAQSFLLSRIFASAFETAETLTKELEARVRERTQELHESNTQLQKAKDELWGEMQLARRIQTVLLPAAPAIAGFEIVAYSEPADQVGGDYYDVIHAGGVDWIVIGDVSGHGVPAGLVMMMTQTAIHTALRQEPGVDPARLLGVVNRVIYENTRLLGDTRKYITITVLSAHVNGVFYFSGLHQDILIHRGLTDEIEVLETQGMWLGVLEDIRDDLPVDSLKLSVGDTMLLFTDGVTEAIRPDGSFFTDERLAALLARGGSLPHLRDSILEALADYRKRDDVTFVLVRRTTEN